MRVLIVGLGVQGYKRLDHAGEDFVASVDPDNSEAEYRNVQDVPLESYDAVIVCTPDEPKVDLLIYFLKNKKHLLVEKPLWAKNDEQIKKLESISQKNQVVCYTAYNHRFEPHFIRMRELIESGSLGKIYSCRMFYGNGTAKLVRDSIWRDQGAGVLPDLGSHLLDTCHFWFGNKLGDFGLLSANNFENKSPDHVIIGTTGDSQPRIELEMTLCMWKNHFTCDILAEHGTAHIESLCKWGPSTFTHRTRILPSGRPKETAITITQPDPTWKAEYIHFKKLIESNVPSDLSHDLRLQTQLKDLGKGIFQ
jgi:scyllo-inositol 2-dehydrogenase (NADP+)